MKQHPKTKKQIRRSLIDWKRSVKETQTKCYITGSEQDLEIHHANHSFADIFKEAHNNLNLEYHEDTKDYSEADFQALVDEVVRLHEDVIPVVLTHDIHLKLHKTYGSHVNMDQINEFKTTYQNNNKGVRKHE